MAYPTGMLAVTLQDIDRLAIQLKAYANNAVAALNGTVTSTQVLAMFSHLSNVKAQFSAAAGVSGLAQYAKDQKNSQSLDVVAEFTAMIAAIDTCRSWISTNFPKDANGYLLAATLGEAALVDRTFTSAQTVNLKTVLQSLAATIS
jgi:hypothetical protein